MPFIRHPCQLFGFVVVKEGRIGKNKASKGLPIRAHSVPQTISSKLSLVGARVPTQRVAKKRHS
ncbi:hypothetical protein JOD18_002344 [Gracilibacillus alcaliphilus]|nr:hypothetical protein [Gracilibacillus alcaliphilus]